MILKPTSEATKDLVRVEIDAAAPFTGLAAMRSTRPGTACSAPSRSSAISIAISGP
jgi:hypothetical protein